MFRARSEMMESLEGRQLLSATWSGAALAEGNVDAGIHASVAHPNKKAAAVSPLVGTYKGTAGGIINGTKTTTNDKVTVVVSAFAAKKTGSSCTVTVTYQDSFVKFSYSGTAVKIPGQNGFSVVTNDVPAFNLILGSKGRAGGSFAGTIGKTAVNVVFGPDFHHA